MVTETSRNPMVVEIKAGNISLSFLEKNSNNNIMNKITNREESFLSNNV